MKYHASLDWEEQELDRAFDISNMMFGAALGAYVGVIIATDKLPISAVWWLVGALFTLGMALYSARAIAHFARGTHRGSLFANCVVLVLGVVLSMAAFAKSGFRLDIAFAMEVGWFGMLTYLLGAHAFRKVSSK